MSPSSRTFLPQLHAVLWVGGASCLYTLTSSSLSKWEVDDNWEHQVLSWDVQRALSDRIAETIWVSVATPVTRLLETGGRVAQSTLLVSPAFGTTHAAVVTITTDAAQKTNLI